MKICVVGTGYVGLVAGAGFAEHGSDVNCVDIDSAKIASLKKLELPIYEPGLEPLVTRNVEQGRLHFTTDVASAVAAADVVFSAVGTPPHTDGSADLSHVWQVARAVGEFSRGFTVFVNKSTVPVGTADRVMEILREHGPDKDFAVVSNPEFLKEGDAVNDFIRPARVIIGTNDERALKLLRYLYSSFVRTQDRIVSMDARSAEVTKYACNAMLATRISFMNEMASLCTVVGADIEQVRLGMAWDNRIGSRFLFAGVGYGGSCFPKDVKAIIATASKHGKSLKILNAVEEVNNVQKESLANAALSSLGGGGKGATVAVWGLAFKPNTDDVREAPALTICNRLLDVGVRVRLHDPVAIKPFREALGRAENVTYCLDNYDAVAGANALILVTEWPTYRRPDFGRVKNLMKTPNLFDGRNIWDADYLRAMGFQYLGIGRP